MGGYSSCLRILLKITSNGKKKHTQAQILQQKQTGKFRVGVF